MHIMKRVLIILFTSFALAVCAQETYPVNGSLDKRPGLFAFTNATIVVSGDQTITNGTLLIKGRTIEAIATGLQIPKGYVIIDLKGKFIYPSLVDAFSSYGIPSGQPARSREGNGVLSSKHGAFSWNEAIHPESSVKSVFTVDTKQAEELRKSGFGTVHSVSRDGIARGTSTVATLGTGKENELILKDDAAALYSFSKGTSTTSYPESLMGAIALLRQTYLDAKWYGNQKEEYNISLAEFNRQQNLPQIFDADNWQDILRADKIGDEAGKHYMFKSGGDEYQRLDLIKATNGALIVPLNFPNPFDVDDPDDANKVSLAQMKHWELAPGNPAALEKSEIKFAITSFGLDGKEFWTNLRKAMDFGLSEKQALKSLTEIPAQLLLIDEKVGTLAKGKLANFIICSGNLFKKDNIIHENWVQGTRFIANQFNTTDISGTYELKIDGLTNLNLNLSGLNATVNRSAPDSAKVKASVARTGDQITLSFNLRKEPDGAIILKGHLTSASPLAFKGEAEFPDGSKGTWSAVFKEPGKERPKTENNAVAAPLAKINYPFGGFGFEQMPKAEPTLFRNATVWTNEQEGKLLNSDILIEGGKIKAIGKNLPAGNATVIDATNKHITAGVIDEHSHITISGNGNEGTQSVTSEVRISDVIDPTDISVYRQLAGGVTSSHILHGSANSIGGQTQIIKLRWGRSPEEMKFEGADGFIKFALGENVKQSNWGPPVPNRFPQTRMGTEQVFLDAFTRAKAYKAAWASYNNAKVKTGLVPPRKDLEMEALAEILDNKRFITCHSYVQSEINMLMHLSDSLGFRINTFTHIIEGYKVADKMKARNIAAGTFSDWWGYKHEVAEAIPYNGKIMNAVGVLTAFNSDDAEGARHLNQEAGKAVMYGGVREEEALKFVTANPAKILHIDNRVGSIKVGKDADLVLWTAHPLSIYARSEKTYVDGIPYWDAARDARWQQEIAKERARLVRKMMEAKNSGAKTQRAVAPQQQEDKCENFGN